MPGKNTLAVGQIVEGFEVQRVTPLPGLRAVAFECEHRRSGGRLLHVHCDDNENLFSVTFPTPPTDDTGLPHILEHCVLGGSRRFPVKEPFFEMVKASMATFINAMTAQDHTLYPVASTVRKDLFNLADVYFDAVFHPDLKEETFLREGHHLALARNGDPSSILQIKGIVYSEMKAAYSMPDAFVWRHCARALFPDSPLGRDSGGDPDAIPSLTFARFRNFFETLYHPSNACFFVYGDIPTPEYLVFLKPRLDEFERREIRTGYPRQSRWSEPRRETLAYPVGANESPDRKTFVVLNWLTGDATDAADVTALDALMTALVGNEAAPLKKAMIDSGLGEDLYCAGVTAHGCESAIQVGIRGSEPDRADRFLGLVQETLTRLADGGISKERLDAAFQQLAYQHLEILPSHPLHLLGRVHEAWIYGADPLTYLRMNEHLEACRRRFEADPGLPGRLIRERILGNPHRALLTFVPDPALQGRKDAEVVRRMEERKARLTTAEVEEIGRKAEALEIESGKPNSPEALAALPHLRISDLPPKPRHIPTTVDVLPGGMELLRNDVFANGVCYLVIDVNLDGLPPDLYPYLMHFAEAFHKLGAAGQAYTRIAERKAASTGGVSCWHGFLAHVTNPGRSLPRLRYHLKTLDRQVGQALAVLDDLAFALDPRDPARHRDVVRQTREGCRMRFVEGGAWPAVNHACRGLSSEGFLNHLIYGLPSLERTDILAERFNEVSGDLFDRIEAVRDFALARGRWTASFTGGDEAYGVVRRTLEEWSGRLRDEPVPAWGLAPAPPVSASREGLATPMETAHCAVVMPAPSRAHPDAPMLMLGARLVSFDYCLAEVRLKGNSYGAGCSFDARNRTLALTSYADPMPARTLGLYGGLRDFVFKTAWTPEDINRNTIGGLKDAEAPIRPGEATDQALCRHVTGETREVRERRYEAALRATPGEVKRVLLDQLEANGPRARACVISSREKLEAANREMPGRELAVEDIFKE